MGWPGHAEEAEKALNYAVWSKVLDREVKSGRNLTNDDWSKLADWADKVCQGSLKEPKPYDDYRHTAKEEHA
jgi:hypothetical protein